ncbi:isoflavone 3'-hydroxylase-like [Chenopodium quinoa]|uniref:isoflavone 3'-hydroxylase-like n=1 Tax=Chenopodium quinoa TaxID=63459 RepID=UPI000B775BBA|nr:isoflavone 3'-hydroxylase-like [Chenopodium quinoa]
MNRSWVKKTYNKIVASFSSHITTKTLLHKLKNYPPSPFPTLPILGHLHLVKDHNSIHRTFSSLSQKLGPVITLQFGSRRALLVSSPSAVEDCLLHNDICFANRPRLVAGKILGYDFTTMSWAPYDPLWRNHRKIAATEILSSHRLHLLANIRADEVRSLVKRIISQKGGDEMVVVEVKKALFELTNNAMMRMVAGKRIYGEAEVSSEAKRFQEVVKELIEIGAPTSVVDFFPFLKYLGIHYISKEKKYKALFLELDKFLQDLVDEKRCQGVVIDCGGKNKTLIEVLINLQNSDPSFFNDDIIKGLVQYM